VNSPYIHTHIHILAKKKREKVYLIVFTCNLMDTETYYTKAHHLLDECNYEVNIFFNLRKKSKDNN
jgi:hypothetical protein